MHVRRLIAVAFAAIVLTAGIARAAWVEDSIAVPGAWVGSLVYNSHEDVVVGSTWSGDRVFVIDCATNDVVATIPLSRPGDLALDTADNKIYCVYAGDDEESLAVIDGHSYQVTKRLKMHGSTTPLWDPVSDKVYVTCQTQWSVAVVDCRTDSLLRYIPVEARPIKLYMNTLRRKLYVLNSDAHSVSIVDLRADTVLKTVYVGGYPNAGWYCRRTDKFCTQGAGGNIAVIDGRTDTIAARISLPVPGSVLAVTGNDDVPVVLVGVYNGPSFVYAINPGNDSVTSQLYTGREPYGFGIGPSTSYFYVANASSDNVAVLTHDGLAVIDSFHVGNDPFVFQAVQPHNRLYVGHLGCDSVYVIRDEVGGIEDGARTDPAFARGLSADPNPFVGATVMRVDVPAGDLSVEVHSVAGSLVRHLQRRGVGCDIVWDGRDDAGRVLPAGVYAVVAEGLTGYRTAVVKAR